MEELSGLFRKMPFITGTDDVENELKMENDREMKNEIQSRRRSLPAITIPQTDKWIQDVQVEGTVNYLSNADAINEAPVVRNRKQTEKGLAYSLGILFDKRKRLLSRLERKSENIIGLMEKLNVRAISEEFKQYEDLLKLFLDVHYEYHGKLEESQQEADDFWFDEVDQEIFTFKHSVINYLQENEEVMSKRSGSSRKTKSSSGSSSKSRSLRKSIKEQVINEKMKLAELEALASCRKQHKIRQLAVEDLKLEDELAKAKARVKVIQEQEALENGKTFINSGNNSGQQIKFSENAGFRNTVANNSQSLNQNQYGLQLPGKSSMKVKVSAIPETFATASPSQPLTAPFLNDNNNRFIGTSNAANISIPVNNTKSCRGRNDGDDEGVSEMICKLLQHQGAPEVELDKFSGNPMEYQYFVTMFKSDNVKISDQMGRLTRLIKFTDGEAKELIRHCIHLPPEAGYETAVKPLNNRYGNPHYLLASYRKEIRALPPVKPGDASGFRNFYNFVLKCETFSKCTCWNALETPETLCILVSKFPGRLRDSWNRKVQVVRRTLQREPCLADISSFVSDETTLVNDPIFSRDAVQGYVQTPDKRYDRKHDKKYDRRNNYGNFATKGGEVEVKCSLCEGNHDLDDCSSFLQFELQERSKWLYNNKLCYGCLNAISVNHNARNCKNRKECKVCKKRNPTSLHGYRAEKSKEKQSDGQLSDGANAHVNCATAKTKSDIISMCVVPVFVRHKLSNRIVKTYAMLDNCSQATFMQKKHLGDLGLHGRKTLITVKTMNGEVTKSSEVLDDIEVAQASNGKEEKVWVKLPSTYTRKELPVDSREVATSEKLKRWKYLDRLKPVMNVDDNKEVSLLIGANCVRALEPREIISSQHGGPMHLRHY